MEIYLDGAAIRDAYDLGGLQAVRRTVRNLLRPYVEGRASSRADVLLLREWWAVETDDQMAFWTTRLTRKAPPADVPGAPETALCALCGAPFERSVGARGRPRTRCWTCSPART